MKKNFVMHTIVCCALLFFASHTNMLAQPSNDCNLNANCTDWTAWIDSPTNPQPTVTLPSFPNCPIPVKYKYRICQSTGEIQFYLYEFGPWCDEIDQYLHTNGQIDWDKLAQMNVDLWRELVTQDFLNIPQYIRQAQYPCPSSQKIYTASWSSCMEWATVNVSNDPQHPEYVCKLKGECGEYCCKLERKFCYDVNTQQNVIIETWVPATNISCNITIPIDPMDSGCIPFCSKVH